MKDDSTTLTELKAHADNFVAEVDITPFIPLDKSWMIRLGVLDLVNESTDMIRYLQGIPSEHLCTDLQSLLNASIAWHNGKDIDVGESGTLYRFLQFADWIEGGNRKFIKRGTLAKRAVTDDPSIVKSKIEELLRLDNGTSQWASIAVLLGNTEERLQNPPYKLAVTYEALDHWREQRKARRHWHERFDATIQNQAQAYVQWLETNKMVFFPEQAEDYCFARAFDLIDAADGARHWPSLRQHESDRITTMEVALTQKVVDSADHRVVQAIAMRKGDKVNFSHPESVTKSWPLFWEMWDIFYKHE